MYRLLFITLLLVSCSNIFAQEVEDKKSRFPLFELNKGNDDTKNLNWGNFHFSNESYRKAAARFSKVKNPTVDIQRKTAKAYMEIDLNGFLSLVFAPLIALFLMSLRK